MRAAAPILAIDLGKSRCRAAFDDGVNRGNLVDAAGTPGLAAPGGDTAALAAILPLIGRLTSDSPAPSRIAVGAAGAWAAPAAAARLAVLLHQETGAATAVASDVVTAHAGALLGGEGVLLITGTGAVALGIHAEAAHLVDGWGPDLGDFGSGSWIGREAVRAVLRARDGLGPDTALTAALAALIGDDHSPLTWLAGDMPVARRLATAAPLVLELAEAGDREAVRIRDEAVVLLQRTADAARRAHSHDSGGIALHGGLTEHPGFRRALTSALTSTGYAVSDAAGDALRGATLIAQGLAPLHERHVHRAG